MAKSKPRKSTKSPNSKRKNPWTLVTSRSEAPEAMPSTLPEVAPMSDVIPILRPKPSDDEIRARAYAIYLSRAGSPRRPVDDWLDAERELASTG